MAERENQQESIIVSFLKFLGLRSGRENSIPFSENGVGFVEATNCEITKEFKPQRRRGYQLLQTENYHSIFPDMDEDYFLAEKNGDLLRVKVDSLTSTVEEVILLPNVGEDRIFYIDTAMGIYFTNGIITGRIVDGVYSSFPSITTQYKSQIPAGDLIEFYNSTLYIAKGKYLYISDPYIYYRFDTRSGILSFPSDITMIAEVGTGLYVGTEDKVYFLQGTSYRDMTLQKKLDYHPIKGAFIKLKGVQVVKNFYFNGVAFVTPKGICIGGDDGNVLNLTEKNYSETFNGIEGISLLHQVDDVNQIIFVLK